jgi:ABC-type amino acid transport substrate-binding protein
MLDGYFVGVFPYGKNPERDEVVLYSDPLWVFKGSRLFSRTDNKTNFNNLSGVGGAFLCLGSHHSRQWLKDYLVKGTFILFEAPKVDECFKMLAAKRVDAVAIDLLTGVSIIKQQKLKRSNFKISKKNFVRHSSRHFLVAKSGWKSKIFLERFNKSLAAIRASGAYDKILRRYK